MSDLALRTCQLGGFRCRDFENIHHHTIVNSILSLVRPTVLLCYAYSPVSACTSLRSIVNHESSYTLVRFRSSSVKTCKVLAAMQRFSIPKRTRVARIRANCDAPWTNGGTERNNARRSATRKVSERASRPRYSQHNCAPGI